MSVLRVAHFGLGPIGSSIVRQIVTRPGLKSVAAIDIDPAKEGRDLADVAAINGPLGVTVQSEAARTLKAAEPDVVIHCTSSSVQRVLPELELLLQSGIPIVSTTEELAYPRYAHKREADQIDERARRSGVAVLGTGVNPGFAMDAWPIMLTAVCERVDRVVVNRIQDARIRRLPFQQKIGAGLTVEQFQERVAVGTVRHVGFTESIAMIGDALGWTLERITDDVHPRVARAPIASEFLTVEPGFVCGLVQDGVGYRNGDAVVHLHLEAYLGAPETYDAVDIDGAPPLSVKATGGIHGDIATASMVVNAIPRVLAAAPGLHTMRDLPLPSYFPGLK